MNRYRIAAALLTACALSALTVATAAPKSAIIKPSLSLRLNVQEQPFSGEMRFTKTPGLAAKCTLKVALTSMRSLSENAVFRMMKSDVYNMPITPDTVVWEAPIDSGDTKTFAFVFTPTLVGTHQLWFARRTTKSWSQLSSLQLNFDEDGKTICAGPADSCRQTVIPPHPRRTDVPITVEFPINELEPRRSQDRHFSSIFRFTPAKAMKDTIAVEFELECHVGLYTEVQFQLETSNNISASKLPESWGDKAGPAPGYRLYNGKLSMVPMRAGLTLFDFKVIGKNPIARGDSRVVTEFTIHMVIGENGEILFAGNFDPYTRFKNANDPMLGSLQQLLTNSNREYRTRIAVSLPDYRGEEVDARDGTDTSESDTTKKSE